MNVIAALKNITKWTGLTLKFTMHGKRLGKKYRTNGAKIQQLCELLLRLISVKTATVANQ